MSSNWNPAHTTKELHTQVAFDDRQIRFRFQWEQPDPGGWIHDMLVYHDGQWQQFADPSPWISGQPDHTGFYEDRISFFLDDGSVKGFEEFGGWLTTHDGMRSLPSAATIEEVRAHPHYGTEGLDRTDIRKYIPQACAGDWWEGNWQEVRPPEELATLKRNGVFLDLPMWRAHRSDPLGYGTDHHVLEYRHSDAGQNTYGAQSWDADSGPEYMWDPAAVEDGALDYHEIRNGNFPAQGSGTYALKPDERVPFDPAVAEWEGAMIPRRPLRQPHGSAADWTASGTWADGQWNVEMRRDLQTDNPLDTKQLEPGGVYTWAPAIHHGAGKRWHWVGYPRRLGLGVQPESSPRLPDPLIATRVTADEDWSDVPTNTSTLVFPGIESWSDLVHSDHPRSAAVRTLSTTMWQLHRKEDS
jgi:hypothetical protein